MEIDRNRNVRITIKNYASMTTKLCLERRYNSRSDTEEGYFNFWVLLNILLGFYEDYKRPSTLATN